jgi:hypothetical protein
MANTYEAIAKSITTGSETVITFSSIPQTYKDLILLISARSSGSGDVYASITVRPNGSTSITSRTIEGGGAGGAYSGSYSGNAQVGYVSGSTATASAFGNAEIYFPNYAGSALKQISGIGVGETNSTTSWLQGAASLYNATTAITSIEIRIGSATAIAANSRFDLYGIKNS